MTLEERFVDRVRQNSVRIPPYPAAAVRLSSLLAREDYKLSELVSVLKADQVLAAATLRLANSAAYRRGQEVSDLPTAVSRIGARNIQALALAVGLEGPARSSGSLAELRRHVWLEALCSARVCELLAPLYRVQPEVAFIAGLLHDFGKTVAIATFEDILVETARSELLVRLDHHQWMELVDRFHVEVGMVIASRWRLPANIATVMKDHHQMAVTDSLTALAALSDEIVRLFDSFGSVNEAELSTVASLTAEGRQVLVEGLRSLPSFIAAFDGDKRAERPSMVSSFPPEMPVATGLPVLISGANSKSISAPLCNLEGERLVVEVPFSIQAGYLVMVSFAPEPEVPFCAKVQECAPYRSHFFATLSPFALNPTQLQDWKRLSSECRSETASL